MPWRKSPLASCRNKTVSAAWKIETKAQAECDRLNGAEGQDKQPNLAYWVDRIRAIEHRLDALDKPRPETGTGKWDFANVNDIVCLLKNGVVTILRTSELVNLLNAGEEAIKKLIAVRDRFILIDTDREQLEDEIAHIRKLRGED